MKIREFMMAAVIAALVVPLAATAAHAGSVTGVCGPVPTQSDCQIATLDFPGGRLSIDVDIDRRWPFVNYRTNWDVWDSQGPTSCKREFWSDDPPASWTCDNIHAGPITLNVGKQTPDFAHLGLRW
ncbi:hypothetical protein JNUCC0626_22450 [Lentzea sp. JNUCC 0626]|uniref:hypothetical protein n=1 Tax=Lentzea sp. JNUCC 0626 TaxID=3367513 RepID=UPI00374800C9